MKKCIAALAATLIFSALTGARGLDKVQSLYRNGMYSQALVLLQEDNSPEALGWRALCELALKTDNAYSLAGEFLELYPEHILAPQVLYNYGLDLFDKGRYEEALLRFNRISAEDLLKTSVRNTPTSLATARSRALGCSPILTI